MTTHELKIHPAPFAAILAGTKTHEIRSTADRTFAVGDVLHLREWVARPENAICTACDAVMSRYEDYEEYQHQDARCGGLVVRVEERGYTGRSLRVVVTHITPGGEWNPPAAGVCAMSIRRIEP